jgi:hypothetical protein
VFESIIDGVNRFCEIVDDCVGFEVEDEYGLKLLVMEVFGGECGG